MSNVPTILSLLREAESRLELSCPDLQKSALWRLVDAAGMFRDEMSRIEEPPPHVHSPTSRGYFVISSKEKTPTLEEVLLRAEVRVLRVQLKMLKDTRTLIAKAQGNLKAALADNDSMRETFDIHRYLVSQSRSIEAAAKLLAEAVTCLTEDVVQ